MKQLYTIYYLPNCIREGYLNSKGFPQTGKIGYTTNLYNRLSDNKSKGNDITNYEILLQQEMTKQEAKQLELNYQIVYDCLDSKRNPGVKAKTKGFHHTEYSKLLIANARTGTKHTNETKILIGLSKVGKPRSEETKRKISEGKKGKAWKK